MLAQSAKRGFADDAALDAQLTLVDAFEPNPPGQLAAFRSEKHQVILSGGNKAGKTYCCTMKLVYRTLPERDKYGAKTGWLLDPYVRTRVPRGGIQALGVMGLMQGQGGPMEAGQPALPQAGPGGAGGGVAAAPGSELSDEEMAGLDELSAATGIPVEEIMISLEQAE